MPHVFRRQDLFGGRGEVAIANLLGETSLPPFSAALWCELAPGGRVGAHVQETDAELVIVLSGAGTVTVGGENRAVAPGDLVALSQGESLEIENGSNDKQLVYLIIKAR